MDLNEMKISNYLDEICLLIKNKKAHSRIKDTIKLNIDTLTEKYEKQGNPRAKSIDLALANMGSSKKLGREINQEFKLNFNPKLLILLGIFLVTSYFILPIISMLNSPSNEYRVIFYGLLPMFYQNLAFIILAPITIFIVSRIYFNKFKKLNLEIDDGQTSSYLNDICSHIKNKRVHAEVRKELKSHIESLIKHYEKLGHTENESITLALNDLGSSGKLGKELNESHKAKIDFKLVVLSAVLIIIGFIGTLTFFKEQEYQNSYGLYLILAVLGFLLASNINFKFYKKLAIPFYILGLLSCYPVLLGKLNSLFELIPITGQSAFAPMLFLFGLSGIYLKFSFKNMKSTSLAILLGIVPLIFLLFQNIISRINNKWTITFIPYSPQLISFIIYSVAFLFVLYIACKNFKIVIGTAILEIFITAVSIYSVPKMLFGFSSSASYKFTEHLLKTSKFISITHKANSINFASPNYGYSLTNLIVYSGWLFGIIAILLLLYFVFRLYKNSININNTFGKSLAFSITVMLSVRIILGILINLNLMPSFMITIPLISFTNIEVVTTGFLLGVIININKVKNLTKV
ncbi:permease prefix domain 1-containing protein, partial [uncultured Clostridium sp.]|uniref:permease prefix domain 1-containing protein n=1 Tax=uncultured Clostridium sp. TaxID=59620 RepID=UPI002613CBF0